MKKIYWLLLLLVSVGFGACDADPELFQEKDSFIAFAGTSAGLQEDAIEVLKIPVTLSTVSPKQITLDFEILVEGMDAPAEEGVDFQLVNDSQKLTFSKGVISDTIQIQAIDNDLQDGDKQFKIKLTSNSAGVSIGLAGGAKAEFVVTILDDEHPLAMILGDYTGNDYLWSDGSLDYSYDMKVEADPEDETIAYVFNLWEGGYSIAAKVDIENKTMSILPGQIIFNYPGYGDFIAVRIDPTVPAFDPTGNISCTIDDAGNITTEAWAAMNQGNSYGNYLKTVMVKK